MNRLLQCAVVALTFMSVPTLGSEPIEIPSAVDYFEGTIEDAIENAKEEDQRLLVYFYTLDCASCEYMYEEFQGIYVGYFLNDRFINFKVDANDEESNGPDTASRFSVDSYPTLLILDHDGEVMHRITRAMEGSVLKNTIRWVTGETKYPMADDDAKYEGGERDPVFVQQYLLDARTVLPKNLDVNDLHMKAWGEAHDKYTAITQEYLASRGSEDLINERDFLIVKAYSKFLDDPGIKLVLDHFDAYVIVTSMEQVSATVLAVASDTAVVKALEGDETYLDVIDALEEEPLKKAADWQRSIHPASWYLPENQHERLKEIFDVMRGEAD
ncbi:MAG: thioredoxin family protein [Gammaproteobacteria bacterium]|nr:thioredoxin family protein [Gammaproteobacteria bacterium]